MKISRLAILAALPFLCSCETVYQKTGYGSPDWIGEELAELGIKHYTGADIDLSPETPE